MAQKSTAQKSVFVRTVSTPIILTLILLGVAGIALWAGDPIFSRTIVEMFIRVMVVVGLHIFIGNSGVISFGHIGFMGMGAYATAWFTIPPAMKRYSLKGLPDFILHNQLTFYPSIILATLFAGLFAAIFGKILVRLSGIAASIATFAMLAMINTVYSNWDSVTGATSSIVGIPRRTDLWVGLAGAELAVIVAYLYAISRSGLALRAARDEPIAAQASGVDIPRERFRAFVLSGCVLGAAGALYAHFLGILTPDAFYLGLTFLSLSMLVVGGMNSLSGAVVGVIVLSAIIEGLRTLEKGVAIAGQTWALPHGAQEIAIGAVMIVILIVRPTGLTRNQEFAWPLFTRHKETSA